jgi:hypothetical protein
MAKKIFKAVTGSVGGILGIGGGTSKSASTPAATETAKSGPIVTQLAKKKATAQRQQPNFATILRDTLGGG